ncbi:MAG TPA: CocE/NonD family hydrolase [Mycobacteriales bacterium]|nr:CocE/NonD family hydrolase [Mycobacteriales bacterium]
MSGHTAAQGGVLVQRDVVVLARDGARLITDVHLPGDGRPHPSLVVRTPYGKTGIGERYRAGWLAAQGYSVVVQEVRGTFGSDGEFDRAFGDGTDAYDCVEWAAAQGWSTGRVGMFGASAMAGTQWACAQEAPPSLVAIAPEVVATGGALRTGLPLEVNLMFAVAMAGFELEARKGEWEPAAYAERRRGLDAAMADPETVLTRLPLSDQPLLEGLAPFFARLLGGPQDWNLGPIDYARIQVPAFVVGGWYDFTLGGVIAQYVGMRSSAGSERARSASRLLVGPWYHGNHAEDPADLPDGWVPVTVGATERTLLAQPAWLEWMAPLLHGREPVGDGPRARVFTMHRGWQDLPDWPPRHARRQDWFLHGAGRLGVDAPGDEPVDTYRFDPLDPVPSPGGGRGGVYDVRAVEQRPDVLAYRSEELAVDTEVTGQVALTLHAATSAVDTDWTARLVEVLRDGTVLNVADTLLRARYRSGPAPTLLAPDEVHELVLDLGAVSYLFRAGSRIGLQVSSSDFPAYDRNPGTGAGPADARHVVVARQRVLHDCGHPSRLSLPVVPG